MPKNLTTSQLTEVAKSELKTRLLVTIALTSPNGPLYLLENDTISKLTINGIDYIGCMVKRGDISTYMDGTVEKCNVTISNVNQAISGLIANQGDVVTNKYCSIQEVIFSGDTTTIIDNPILVFDGYINTIQLFADTFAFDVERKIGGYSNVSPNVTYDVNCQYQFKDIRCAYSGSATVCDKTLTSCQGFSNSTRFGGFPSIPQELIVKS